MWRRCATAAAAAPLLHQSSGGTTCVEIRSVVDLVSPFGYNWVDGSSRSILLALDSCAARRTPELSEEQGC